MFHKVTKKLAYGLLCMAMALALAYVPSLSAKAEEQRYEYVDEATGNQMVYMLDDETQTARFGVAHAGSDGKLVIPETISVNDVTYKVVSVFGDHRQGLICYDDTITEVVISGMTEIEYQAFSTCVNLEKVTLDGVKVIRPEAFNYCRSLKEVVLSDGLISIENNAFAGCEALEKINLPDSLESIGFAAFNNCSALKSITIPDSVINLEEGAFTYCGLTEVHLGTGIFVLNKGMFHDCKQLKEVTVPGNCAAILDSAFACCDALEKVTVSEGVQVIGKGAFDRCQNLSIVSLPEGLTEIGDEAFTCCEALKGIAIPSTVKRIGKQAFYACHNLEGIVLPEGITEIGSLAFYECAKINTVVLPKSLTLVDDGAFYLCGDMEEVITHTKAITPYTFDGTNVKKLTVMCDAGASADDFKDCAGFENALIEIKSHDYTKYKVACEICGAELSNAGFCGDPTVNDGRDVIWEVQESASGSRTLLISGTGAIADYSGAGAQPWIKQFGKDKDSIKEVKIGEGITRIGSYSMSNLINLDTITLPETLKEIGKGAFIYTRVFSFTIPAAVEIIEDDAFMSTDRTVFIDFAQGSKLKSVGHHAFFASTVRFLIFPEGVETFGNGVFCYNPELLKVVIPRSVKTFESDFQACSNYSLVVEIPCNVNVKKNVFATYTYQNLVYDSRNFVGKIVVAPGSQAEKVIRENYPDQLGVYFKMETTGAHEFDAEGKCIYCGYECGHANENGSLCENGKCTYCGYDCLTAGHVKNTNGCVADDNATHSKICSVCGLTLVDHEAHTPLNGAVPTCETGVNCEICNAEYQAALGHDMQAVFNFAADGKTCSATLTCSRQGCGRTITGDCNVSAATKIAPSYVAMGTTTYTATIECDGQTYQGTKDVVDIAKLILGTVQHLHVNRATSNDVELEWEPLQGATGYIVEVKIGNTWSRAAKLAGGNMTGYRVTGLQEGSFYYFRVRGYAYENGQTANGANSAAVSAWTKFIDMSDLNVAGTSHNAVRLSWAKNPSAEGYQIEQLFGSEWKMIKKIPTNDTTEYRIAGLEEGMEYNFRIRAYKVAKNVAYSEYSYAVARTKLNPVTGIAVAGTTNNAIRIKWVPNLAADGYRLEQFVNGEWVLLKRLGGGDVSEYRIANLLPATKYSFRVCAYKKTAVTTYSTYAEISAQTKFTPLSDVGVGGRTTNAIRLIWGKNLDATGYQVEQYINGSWRMIKKLPSNETTEYRITGLASKTKYSFRVRAYRLTPDGTRYTDYVIVNATTK